MNHACVVWDIGGVGSASQRAALSFSVAGLLLLLPARAQVLTSAPVPCRIESTEFDGWQAEQLSNPWVTLTIVPQLGGRLMQIRFDGHPYLFINAKYKGQYISPSEAGTKGRWINYGGDKLWPMPEGSQDENHWPGPISDALDDGAYALTVVSRAPRCTVRLDGPSDAKTGLQYSREISLGGESPEVRFHAVMKNSSDHAIQWSVQTVTQYDTSASHDSGKYNHDFWAFAPANEHSAYLEGYHVRSGLSDDPSYSIKNSLFVLHWLPLENEVWLDSTGGWLAVVDGSTRYAMVERFRHDAAGQYPDQATLIFYKNGSTLEVDDGGSPRISPADPENSPRYMEAEINSPVVAMEPGKSYAMDTEWFPVRMGKEFTSVAEAGVAGAPLSATRTAHGVRLAGSLGVFLPGRLEVQLSDSRGVKLGSVSLKTVNPKDEIELDEEVDAPAAAWQVSVHLIDLHGKDRGTIATAAIKPSDRSS